MYFKKRKVDWLATSLYAGLLIGALVYAGESGPKNQISMQVIEQTSKNVVWLRTYTAPAMQFKILEGGDVKERGLACVWHIEERHEEKFIVLDCQGDHKLELTMVDFGN